MSPEIKKLIMITSSTTSSDSQHGYRVAAQLKREDASDGEFKKQLEQIHECISQVVMFGKSGVTISIEAVYGVAGVWPYLDDQIILAICARAGWDPAMVEIQRQVDSSVVETIPAGEYTPAEDIIEKEIAACHGSAEDEKLDSEINRFLINAALGEFS